MYNKNTGCGCIYIIYIIIITTNYIIYIMSPISSEGMGMQPSDTHTCIKIEATATSKTYTQVCIYSITFSVTVLWHVV